MTKPRLKVLFSNEQVETAWNKASVMAGELECKGFAAPYFTNHLTLAALLADMTTWVFLRSIENGAAGTYDDFVFDTQGGALDGGPVILTCKSEVLAVEFMLRWADTYEIRRIQPQRRPMRKTKIKRPELQSVKAVFVATFRKIDRNDLHALDRLAMEISDYFHAYYRGVAEEEATAGKSDEELSAEEAG